ncbi:MAG: RDD family protein, partial [Halolamina sp.]
MPEMRNRDRPNDAASPEGGREPLGYPTPAVRTERDVIGERVAAALVDLGVVFPLYYAGLYLYTGASGVPSLEAVIGSLFWFIFQVFGLMPFFLFRHGHPLLLFLSGALLWGLYAAILELSFGRTLGKRVTGLVVATPEGGRPSPRSVLIRNALRVVDGLLFYLVGFLFVVLTDRCQRLGDLVADTVIVATED